MRALVLLLLANALLLSQTAFSFPQMISHGYRACATCHVSPTGGGALTQYGRGMSVEALSMWAKQKEEQPLNGSLEIPDWLTLSGDLRAIQLRAAAEKFVLKKFTLMQADIEVGFKAGDVTAIGTMGYQNPSSNYYFGMDIFSRRHYLMWQPDNYNWFRIGKYELPYGTNWADHWMLSKNELGFGEGAERYVAQWVWDNEKVQTSLYGTIGRPDAPKLGIENGAGVRTMLAMSDTAYVSFNTYFGWTHERARWLFGPGLVVSPAEWISFFADMDLQSEKGKTGSIRTFRINLEPLRGLHAFWVNELDRTEPGSEIGVTANTIGLQFFPRPHFEISAGLQFSSIQIAWVLGHYYL